MIHGELKNEEDDFDDRSTPSPSSHSNRRITEVGTAVSLPPLTIKEKPPINVVGDVGGRIAIMVDDLIDNVKPFVDAAIILKGTVIHFVNKICDPPMYFILQFLILTSESFNTFLERGAYKIYVLATHGILSAEAPRLIEDSPIDEVVVSNTVPHDMQKLQCHKIKTVDVSILLAEAIRRIHNKESMCHLFRNVSFDD